MSYRIDLTPNASYTETVSVSQDDVGREIVIDLYKDGEAYTPASGTTITMQGTKPSGLGYTITGTADGSSVTFLTTAAMTQESGRFASEVVLTNGTTVIGTANFALYVEKNPHPENTIDGTHETMQNLTVRMDALEDEVDAVGGEIEALNSNLNMVADISYNFFNPETAVTGKFIAGDVGGALRAANNASYAYNVFPVEYGRTYVISRSDYAFWEFDENMICLTRLGNQTARTDWTYTPTVSSAKYLGVSWLISAVSINSFMVTLQGVDRTNYIEYPASAKLTPSVLHTSGVKVPDVYYVGSGKQYETFTDMLVDLKNDESEKVVYIMGGTYDVFEEMGGVDYINSLASDATWSSANNILPPNTSLIGVGNVTLKYTPTTDQITSAAAQLMSPLNITRACHIENITVIAENCRYAIHDETGVYGMGASAIDVHEYINVKAIKTNGSIGKQAAFGCGFSTNSNYLFKDCYFSNNSYEIFSMHGNGAYSTDKTRVVIDHCVFNNDTNPTWIALVFRSNYADDNNYVSVKLNGCSIDGSIRIEQQGSAWHHANPFEILMIGCNRTTIGIDSNFSSNPYENSQLNVIS